MLHLLANVPSDGVVHAMGMIAGELNGFWSLAAEPEVGISAPHCAPMAGAELDSLYSSKVVVMMTMMTTLAGVQGLKASFCVLGYSPKSQKDVLLGIR